MQLATKTLKAIEEALVRDQGAKFRGLLRELMPAAEDAYSTKEDPWRDHLGASHIGRECPRELWYSFHWVTLRKDEGRMIRLFNRGHLEEPRFVALLRMIGCEVWQHDKSGKQFRIEGYRGHFGGSLDGVVRNLPDLPEYPVLAEFKTHSLKSFDNLVAKGVLASKWEHFVQMTLYMGHYKLPWAIYCAVCKNDDSIHLELVQFDPAVYARYSDRSAMIIDATVPPAKINESPGWWKCKFCDHRAVCHAKATPAKNCRTCKWVDVGDAKAWICNRPEQPDGGGANEVLTPEKQRVGCSLYCMQECFVK